MAGGKLRKIPAPLSLGGIRIDALTLNDLLGLMSRAVETQQRLIFLNHNLHSLYLYETNTAFRAAYSLASYVYIDGIPVVWLGRSSGLPINSLHRVTLLDSFEAILLEASRRDWRIFYLGSSKSVNDQALSVIRRKFPTLNISGNDGFFIKSGPENEAVLTKITDCQTDILFIGMGMPNQEQWLAENESRLPVKAILTSGGTLDYVAGDVYKPPAWAGRFGLYGLMRLCADPKRLWRRYLLEPLYLLKKIGFRLLKQRLQLRITRRELRTKQSAAASSVTK